MTPEQKKIVWGDGPWVDEPDDLEFESYGLKCRILRRTGPSEDFDELFKEYKELKSQDPENPLVKYFTIFGGHLCGYVRLPENRKWKDMDICAERLNIAVHGGITYSQHEKDGHWIGFDCAHSGDLIPSQDRNEEMMMETSERFKKIREMQEEFRKRHPFQYIYKTIEFVKAEVIELARQVIEVQKEDK